MSDIVLLDTSILCELLRVPGKCGHLQEGEAESLIQQCIKQQDTLLLPWATVLETGNHVGQIRDGGRRRIAAKTFVAYVVKGLEGEAPWVLTAAPEGDVLKSLMQDFPNWATRGSGLGDLTIVSEYHRQCRLNPRRRVWIWSLDEHLAGFDRPVG